MADNDTYGAVQDADPMTGDASNEPRSGSRIWWRALIVTRRPGFFIALVLISVVAGAANGIRANGIFACQAADQRSDEYLAYCQATGYGDYDHGAFWFGLEEQAIRAAAKADVLFLGNSRLQFGLSSEHLDEWFGAESLSYYLLGFSHMDNYLFTKPLLEKMRPAANAYIVNVDLFFEDRLSPPANDIINNGEALNRYLEKRRWQALHDPLCGAAKFVCRNEVAFYRSRSNGAWTRKGGDFAGRGDVVTYDDTVDDTMLAKYVAAWPSLLETVPADASCIILTNTPQSDTTLGTARRLADRLRLPLVAPTLDGLRTFDGSHLDSSSAARWSKAFVEAAAPYIRKCLVDVSR